MKYVNIQFLKNVFTNQSLYIFIFFLFFQTQLRAQYTSIPDTIFEQKLIDLGIDSEGTLDGQLLTADANGKTGQLSVGFLGINDLTGIEAFTGINNLFCSGNNLTSLNISNLTNLTSLGCEVNSLDSLDVSNLVNLNQLYCSQNNLDSLNVTNLINLTKLQCFYNNISTLDVTNLSLLTSLTVRNNNISTLDLTNLLNLTYLGCNNNNIDSLDLSFNAALTTLSCKSNNLTAIDVSNLVNLTSFTCDFNSITGSLDVSLMANLTNFNCRYNNLSNLDVKNGNNTNITTFQTTGNTNLTCISVDDPAWSTINWTNIDPWTSFDTTCINLCSNLTSPLNNETNVDIDADVFWNTSTNALGYKLIMGTCSGCADILDSLDVGNVTTYDPGTFGYLESIYLTVVPYNSNGIVQGCAEEVFFIEEGPISCTTLSSPLNGSVNIDTEADISWNDVSNEDGYKVTMGTCSGCTDIANNVDVGAVTTYDPGSFSLGDTIYVTIIPYDSSGDMTGCLEEVFYIEGPISCTTLSFPLNGSINIGSEADISWNDVSDEDGYKVTIGTCSGCTDIANNVDVGPVTTYDPGSFTLGTTIFVTIVPYNSNGDMMGCLEESFEIISTVYTLIPDTIFEQRLIDLGIDSEGTLDGQILSGDATAATGQLNVGFLGINDLTGLEAFTGINNLFCSGNNLTSLNISNLTNLTSLGCEVNSLNSLDVSNLVNLINLYCSQNNLDSLNVSNLINLKKLQCYNNNISSLDLTNLSLLTTLTVRNNNLSVLNLNNLPSLTSLDCYNNNIDSLDLNSSTALTAFSCGLNNLTTIDISNLTGLTSFSCERNNMIGNLDVSHMVNLSWFDCSVNNLSTLDVRNGNNTNFINFRAQSNLNLYCISVDDPAWSTINWTNINSWTSFNANCAAPCTYLLTPLNQEADVVVTQDITWFEVLGFDGYKINMGTCSGCVDILDSVDVGNVTTYDPGTFATKDTIYTTIIPYKDMVESLGCPEEVFYTDDEILDCTFLVSPINGAINVGSNVDISWDDDPSADGYKIIMGTCSGCIDILDNVDVGNVTSYDPASFNLGDTIYTTIIPYDTNGDLGNCTEEIFYIDTIATLSGTIEYPNGTIQYSQLIIFDPITFEVISYNTVCINNNSFSIEIPAGIYNVYYKPFQRDAQSYEVFELDLTSDLDTIFVLDPYTTPDYFDDCYWSKPMAFGEGIDTVFLQVEVNASYNIDSMYFYNPFQTLDRVNSPSNILKHALKDDGLENDAVANDGVFTSRSFVKAAGDYDRDNALSRVGIGFFQVYEAGVPSQYLHLFSNLGFVHPTATSTVPLQQWNDSVYINDYLINIVRSPGYDYIGDAQIVYNIFPDSFDFINSFNADTVNATNWHFPISNDVTGIGQSTFDYSNTYGSTGKLKGYSVFSNIEHSSPTNHEVLHQWSNFMTNFFDSSPVYAHNGYSSIDGVHGGLTSFSLVDDTTVQYQNEILYGWVHDQVEFSDLELYMMGVLDTAELRDQFYRIYDPVYQPSNNTYTVSSIDTITPQDIVSHYGYRNPAPIANVPIFKTATVVVTSEPLTEAGNMFYSYLAKIWEGSQVDNGLPIARHISFDEATGYRADMVTKLPAPFCDPFVTLYTPIESGWYKAATKITIAGNPANNAKINLDAPNVDFLDINTFGTNAEIETRVKGCGD